MRTANLRRIGATVALVTAVWAPAANAAKPDLVVRSVVATPATVVADRAVSVTDVTANEGRKRAATSQTDYLLLRRKARIWLGVRLVPVLAPGEHASGTVGLTVPEVARDGSYMLVACADARRQVREDREYNNCRLARERLLIDSVAPVRPDLGEELTRSPTAPSRASRSHTRSVT